MKIQLHLKLLILGTLISSGLFSQKVDYERDTKWNLGFNMGAVWQDSDIKLRTPGFGYGFTFGRSIYERPNSVFGLDLRFRYLRGTTYGMDPNRLTLDSTNTFYNEPEHNYLDSAGYTYLNNSTDLHDYSLEMVLNFHRLRERTGILFHIFGGIGITDYQTKTDLLDKNGNLYNYSGIDTSGTVVSQAQKDLMDGDYESNAYTHNGRQIKVMPSLGFGIGYQVGPSFSIGLEHRTTFTLNDVFEGHAAAGSEFVNLSSGNDLYHYTGINFRWNILKGKYKEPTTVETTPVTNYTPCDKPTVRIINPTANQKFETKYISISAKVSRVKTNNDIVVKVNSQSVQTQYSSSTELVTANLTLANGDNTIEVIASNSCGNTSKVIKVNYQDKQCLKPVIQISSPAQVVNKVNQTLAAKVIHLNGGTLAVYLNGNKVVHNFNSSTQDLSASLNLVKGNNTILIKGSNACGDTSVSLNVTYNEEPCLLPIVDVLAPANGSKSQYQSTTFSARVTNQSDRSKIAVLLNGNAIPFTFSSSSNLVSASLNLLEGNNTIQVKVTNECGADNKTVTVIYEKAPCLAPVFSVVSPQNGQTYSQANVTFSAGVQNVTSGNQLQVKLNGAVVASSYNAFNKTLSANLNLARGNNIISLTATNNCGSVSKEVMVSFACEKPAVSIVYPANGLVVTNGSIQLSGSVINLVNQNQLSVKLNGNALAYSYNSQTKSFSSALNLVNGTNVISVTATNDCGVDNKELRLTYNEAPCLVPVISVVSPQNGQTYSQANVTFSAGVQNVTSGNQLQVKLNGAVVASSYNAFNKTLSANLNLARGNNIISLTATNNCGSVSKEVMVSFACEKPAVSIVYPANGLVVTNGSIQLSGSVINLVNQNQLSVKLNGNAVAYSYNSQTKSFSSALNLVNGTNVISVTATNDCGVDTKEVRVTYNEPCLKPVISITSPVANQNFSTANVALTGVVTNVTNANQVTVEQDGAPVNFSLNGNSISANLVLAKGNNTITITATNSCGTVTVTIPVTYDAPCPQPAVSIVSPQNAQVFNTKTISFVANVSNITNSSQAIISLNGTIVSGTYNGANKTVTSTLNLIEGNNTIKVVAQNTCGSDEKTINVSYKCNTPKINFINKMGAQSVVSVASTTITASVTNVTSANQIVVKINGVVVAHNFDANTGILTISTTLKEGKNTIDVIATNNCGSDTQNLVINYTAPCVAPVLSISSPMNGKTFTSASATLSGSVLNITGQSQITLKLNGVSKSVSYDASNKTYSSNLTLNEGSNTIEVKASNECGSDTKSITVTYNKPCDKPIVNFVKPINNDVVANKTINVEAFVQNVSSQSQLIFRLNGISESFTYDASNGKITATINLQEGENRIFLNASTDCGKDGLTVKVNYNKPCDKPNVVISSPSNGKVVKNPNIQLTGLAYNVTSQNQIIVLLNGVNQTFSFNASSKTYNASLVLNEGANTIEVKATTECGVSSKTITVNYEACKAPTVSITSPTSNEKVTQTQVSYSATLGNVTDRNQITVEVNGAPSTFNFNATTGIVSGVVNAAEGANSIVIIITKECGTARKEVQFTKSAPCTKPVITINQPNDGQQFTRGATLVAGNIQGVSSESQVTLKVNGTTTSFIFNVETGEFGADVSLKEGNNDIVISATNDCGITIKTIEVNYVSCKSPSVSFLRPANSETVTGTQISFLASVNQVTNQNQISVEFNGAPIAFTYDDSENRVSGFVTPVNGTNTISVRIAKDCGVAEDQVVFTKTCLKPTLKVKSHKDRTTIYTKSTKLVVAVNNVKNKNQVSLKLNGRPFSFTLVGSTLSANLTGLVVGGNNIVMEVNTSCGKAVKELFINVQEIKPVIIIKAPVKDTFNTNEKALKLDGTVTGIHSNSDVIITVNGKRVKPTSIKSVAESTFRFIADLNLIDGKNVIVIKASNKYSFTTIKTLVVTSKQPVKIESEPVQPAKRITKPQIKSSKGIRK